MDECIRCTRDDLLGNCAETQYCSYHSPSDLSGDGVPTMRKFEAVTTALLAVMAQALVVGVITL